MRSDLTRLLRVGGCLSKVNPSLVDNSVLLFDKETAFVGIAPFLQRLWPDFHLFQDDALYSSGIFRCEIKDDTEAAYSANRKQMLRFHSDMSLTKEPPQITLMRCVRRDDGPVGSGDDLFIHMSDILARLRQIRRLDIVDVLQRPTAIVLADGSTAFVSMVIEPLGCAPLRVFERIGWQLSPHDGDLIEELLDLCEEWQDIQVRVPVNEGETVVFSNRHFVHARTACISTTRIMEICLGSV